MSLKTLRHAARLRAARVYRSTVLRRIVFVGITGSAGKTTTKELVRGVLATRFRTQHSGANYNTPWHLAWALFRTRPWDEVCVLEVGAGGPDNQFEESVRLAAPKVAVVTNVGMDHFTRFKSIDAVAETKSQLVSALKADGVAVLNADDPRVLSMRDRCAGRVVTYGRSPAATYRAEDVRGDWPDRLSLVVVTGNRSVKVQTQLCGTHWVPSVLAAIAVGEIMGVPLPVAAEAIRTVPPFPGRMSPVETGHGIAFLRDDEKAPMWAMPAFLEFLRTSRAGRKIVVLGTLSDFPGNPGTKYPRVAREVLRFADALIGVGGQATLYLRAAPDAGGKTLKAFADPRQAGAFLREFALPGDLVLLKGSRADRLDSIAQDWAERKSPPIASDADVPPPARVPNGERDSAGPLLVVGLGNPDDSLRHTPHSIGLRVVEELADRARVNWVPNDGALVAKTCCEGQPVWFVKLPVLMNHSGPRLLELAGRLRVGADRCIVVFDDADLPLGTVRRRENGSAGGHRGMNSIIIAFQTEAVRRVKIGVGRPPEGESVSDYVLRPFGAAQRELMEQACRKAADVVFETIASRDRTNRPSA